MHAKDAETNEKNVRTRDKRVGDMIHPSLIAIATIVIVFGILNFIEYKRLD